MWSQFGKTGEMRTDLASFSMENKPLVFGGEKKVKEEGDSANLSANLVF